MRSLAFASVVVIAVAMVGCKRDRGSHRSTSSTGEPDLDRALALRDQAPAGVPTWPAGVTWLGDKTPGGAIVHDGALYTIGQGAITRVPLDGSPTKVITTLDGQRIDHIVATASSLVVLAFPFDGERAAEDGALWAVPFAGGKPRKLGPVKIDAQLAAFGSSLWVADGKRILHSQEPALDKLEVVTDKRHYTSAITADARGVTWLEAEYGTKNGDWVKTIGHDAEVPTSFIIYVMASDGARVYALGSINEAAKTAPGGGEYYESRVSIVAIDGDGKWQAVSPPLDGVWALQLAGARICAVVEGPKLEFAKQTKVVVVPTDGSKRVTTLATGLVHAQVIAADATHCYVTTSDHPGIAVVPLPAT